jgi:dCMP deaminase
MKLSGAEIYTDTFPCPLCAKQIAAAGIVRCYFVTGYASLDGEAVLRDASVELVKLKYQPPQPEGYRWRKYPL